MKSIFLNLSSDEIHEEDILLKDLYQAIFLEYRDFIDKKDFNIKLIDLGGKRYTAIISSEQLADKVSQRIDGKEFEIDNLIQVTREAFGGLVRGVIKENNENTLVNVDKDLIIEINHRDWAIERLSINNPHSKWKDKETWDNFVKSCKENIINTISEVEHDGKVNITEIEEVLNIFEGVRDGGDLYFDYSIEGIKKPSTIYEINDNLQEFLEKTLNNDKRLEEETKKQKEGIEKSNGIMNP